MKDVAALAQVSLGTVSNVMNSPELVSDTTRERVVSAISKLGWVPNESARQLRAGRSRTLGVVVMDIANPFFTDLVLGAEDYVDERGYSVQVSNSAQEPGRERNHLQLLEQQRVGGVLLAPIWGLSDQVRRAPHGAASRSSSWIGRATPLTSARCRWTTSRADGWPYEHLLDQGHTHIALVGGPGDLQQVRDRRLGAELARSAAPETLSLLVISTPNLDAASGVAAAGELAALPAAGAAHRRVRRERPAGHRPPARSASPRDCGCPRTWPCIGYDDISFAASAAVPLSSVRQPQPGASGAGRPSCCSPRSRRREQDEPHEHEAVRFQPELVVRRSSIRRLSAGRPD